MDAKEAIVELTKMLYYENYVFNCIADDNEPETVEVQRNIKSLQLAISALEKVETLEAENARLREKETPKKPKYINNGCNCQCCDRRLPDAILQCCPYCGQRIDWTSDKE